MAACLAALGDNRIDPTPLQIACLGHGRGGGEDADARVSAGGQSVGAGQAEVEADHGRPDLEQRFEAGLVEPDRGHGWLGRIADTQLREERGHPVASSYTRRDRELRVLVAEEVELKGPAGAFADGGGL